MCCTYSSTGFGILLCTSVVLSTVMTGCGGSDVPDLATVSGTIKMDSKPLPDATVLFIPANGRPSSGTTDSSGHYTLTYSEQADGVLPGSCRVMISTGKPGKENDDGVSEPGKPETVPMEYNIDTSLTFEVKPGTSNTADFELSGGGAVAATSKGEDSIPDTGRARRQDGE